MIKLTAEQTVNKPVYEIVLKSLGEGLGPIFGLGLPLSNRVAIDYAFIKMALPTLLEILAASYIPPEKVEGVQLALYRMRDRLDRKIADEILPNSVIDQIGLE